MLTPFTLSNPSASSCSGVYRSPSIASARVMMTERPTSTVACSTTPLFNALFSASSGLSAK
eukprot:scaffold4109_cov133-Isochrysis_galbana.AAC.2